MSKLINLYHGIERILGLDLDLPMKLQSMRVLLTELLSMQEFKIGCVAEIVQSIQNQPKGSAWTCPHLFYHETLQFSVRAIFWPPFYENNPHEHKTWSVTGVLQNRLDVSTYHFAENPRRLTLDKFVQAATGQVGTLVPGCIHKIFNPTHQLSASLHIFNNIDVNNPEENAIWYPAPRKFNLTAGLVDRALESCLQILQECPSAQAEPIIETIFGLGSVNIKLKAIALLCQYNKNRAHNYFQSAIMQQSLSGVSYGPAI